MISQHSQFSHYPFAKLYRAAAQRIGRRCPRKTPAFPRIMQALIVLCTHVISSVVLAMILWPIPARAAFRRIERRHSEDRPAFPLIRNLPLHSPLVFATQSDQPLSVRLTLLGSRSENGLRCPRRLQHFPNNCKTSLCSQLTSSVRLSSP